MAQVGPLKNPRYIYSFPPSLSLSPSRSRAFTLSRARERPLHATAARACKSPCGHSSFPFSTEHGGGSTRGGRGSREKHDGWRLAGGAAPAAEGRTRPHRRLGHERAAARGRAGSGGSTPQAWRPLTTRSARAETRVPDGGWCCCCPTNCRRGTKAGIRGSAGGAQLAGPPGRRRLEERGARFLVTAHLALDSVNHTTAAEREEE